MSYSTGFLYIATGEEFVEEAILSARTVDEHHPGIPISLMTDQTVDNTVFDSVIRLDDPERGFADQIQCMSETPYDRTIYLDTDIYADGNVKSMFELLDNFDIALAHSQGRESWPVEGVPDAFPEYNSGVVAYRVSDRFGEFLSTWEHIYLSAAPDDAETMRNQPSLRKALYESNVRIATLYPEYNCMFRYPGHAVGSVKLFHGRLKPIDGPGAGEYFDAETAVEVINRTDQPRAFTQLGGLTVHTNKEESLIHRARMSYRRHGLAHLLRESWKLARQRVQKAVQ